jgi:hypothetical protein
LVFCCELKGAEGFLSLFFREHKRRKNNRVSFKREFHTALFFRNLNWKEQRGISLKTKDLALLTFVSLFLSQIRVEARNPTNQRKHSNETERKALRFVLSLSLFLQSNKSENCNSHNPSECRQPSPIPTNPLLQLLLLPLPPPCCLQRVPLTTPRPFLGSFGGATS